MALRKVTVNNDSGNRILVIGCGALASETAAVLDQNGLEGIDVEYLPAKLHNRPQLIPAKLRERIVERRDRYDEIFVAYSDCGSGGGIDEVIDEFGLSRLSGPHCYSFYAGAERFNAIAAEDAASYYLTDFLARHFEAIVWRGMGLDEHPDLKDMVFGQYRRLVHLVQDEGDEKAREGAKHAAELLGLELVTYTTGYGELEVQLVSLGESARD